MNKNYKGRKPVKHRQARELEARKAAGILRRMGYSPLIGKILSK